MKKFMGYLGMKLFKVPPVGLSLLVLSIVSIPCAPLLVSKWTNNNETWIIGLFLFCSAIAIFLVVLFMKFSDESKWPKKSVR